MPLLFWIAVGTALAALLLGLLLRARLKEEQVWKELVGPSVPPDALQSEDHGGTDEHPNPQDEEMNSPTATPTSRSPHDADLRRSSRIERPIPLLILGTNRRGEAFQEKTSAVAVNLHGCRYLSHHEYAPEDWLTLQVTGTEANSPVVRARVRSVLSRQTPRELCQVGIELETPGNVWGIPAPPEDWHRPLGTSTSGARAATAVARAPDPSTPLSSSIGKQSAPPERRAEVAVFPGPPAAAATAADVAPAKEPSPTKAARVVVTAEQLLLAMQDRIQLAADKAVQTSLSTQLDQAVKIVLAQIENGCRANVRQTEESSAARLAEIQDLWGKELLAYRSRAEEISRSLETLASEERALLQKAANSTLEEFRRRVEVQIDLILADAKECVTSSLTSLDAESRAAVETHRRALEVDMSRAAEESTMEFRSRIEALLYSCLVTAVSAVDQHAQTILAGLSTDPTSLPRALGTTGGSSPRLDNPPSQPNNPSPSQ